VDLCCRHSWGNLGEFVFPRALHCCKQTSEPFNAGTQSASAIPEKSIAVLPFENASGNPETEYLSDGISEALINILTELQQLKVIARSTAFRYKGKPADPQVVGRELKVRAVLMGLVRQTGERLNVQVDLVDATTGAQLWGEEYERKLSDVLLVKQQSRERSRRS